MVPLNLRFSYIKIWMDWSKKQLSAQSKERSWNWKQATVLKLLNNFFSTLLGRGQLPPPNDATVYLLLLTRTIYSTPAERYWCLRNIFHSESRTFKSFRFESTEAQFPKDLMLILMEYRLLLSRKGNILASQSVTLKATRRLLICHF